MTGTSERAAVSIVCVSNNRAVLADCLARSVEDHLATAPGTELVVVENWDGQFSTAGAALNHGVSLARNEVCAFVHQDVYLHSLVDIETTAARLLADHRIGMVGAIGITGSGELAGQIRDRVMVLGRPTGGTEVDSLDEVFFMARRAQLLEDPLSDEPVLAWHAYAVEYGARMRRAGLQVVASRIPLTHNSLTINLARLTEAHIHVGDRYPEQLPIVTTCGVIAGTPPKPKPLANHRWRYRWLKGSWQAHAARRAVGSIPTVLADIRFDIDGMLDAADVRDLSVVSVEGPEIDGVFRDPVVLERLGRRCTFSTASPTAMRTRIADCRGEESILVTNLRRPELADLRTVLNGREAVVGYADSIGFWLVVGPASRGAPAAWQVPGATPLGLQRIN